MAKAFTPISIEAMKPDAKGRREVPDPALTGLYLVIQPKGAKSWAVRYRFGGKPVKLTLGKWPIMELADARRAASEALAKAERGVNPADEKKAEKAALRAAAAAGDGPDRDSVRALVKQYNKRHLKEIKSGAQALAFLEHFVVRDGAKVKGKPKGGWDAVAFRWGERDIHTITRRDVIDLLDDIVDSGRATTANRVRAHLSGFFNWCVGRDIIEVSPLTGVKPPAKEASRDRVLSDDEMRLFWRACEKVGLPWGPFGQFLLLTGQRLNEAAQMIDAEIEGDVWHLSAARTKNGRAHDVPLSEQAKRILASQPRIVPREGRAPGYLFSTNGSAPLQGFHKARATIADAMEDIASDGSPEGAELAPIPHWTFHDLRRTAATGMARLGIPVRVTEAVLNHVSGTAAGIVSVYQRHDFADEKRQALAAWAGFVERLVDGSSANVVAIRAEAEQ